MMQLLNNKKIENKLYKKRNVRKAAGKIVCLALVMVMILSGCGSKNDTEKSAANAIDLKQKYAAAEPYDYTGNVYEIGRNEDLSIPISFDPEEKGITDLNDIIGLYETRDLEYDVEPIITYNKEEKCIELKSVVPLIWFSDAAALSEQGWGNLGQMYISQKIDFETGEKLAKPLVSLMKVKGELSTPKLDFSVTADGRLILSWTPVENAAKYSLLKIHCNDSTSNAPEGLVSGFTFDSTTDTSRAEANDNETISYNGMTVRNRMNSDFETYLVSEDEWLDHGDTVKEFHPDAVEGEAIPLKDDGTEYYGVIAVNSDGSGCSMVSNLIDQYDVAKSLPNCMASINGEEGETENRTAYANSVSALPAYHWITMCDGTRSPRLVNYDFNSIMDDESDNVSYVPYQLEGTDLRNYMILTQQNPDTLKEECDQVTARQNELRNKGGSKDNIQIQTEDDDNSTSGSDVTSGSSVSDPTPDNNEPASDSSVTPNQTPDDTPNNPAPGNDSDTPATHESGDGIVSPFGITASSALSEYFAQEMLKGTEIIDLSDFPEASDISYLEDAWKEAYYQNPLILGVDEAAISNDGTMMQISYEDSPQDRKKKQQEIVDKVNSVVADVITQGMSTAEKEVAINDYLCKNGAYDDDALKSAEKYNYEKADEIYNDSFTPYGILIKNVGVCASYAASFKLLSDAAGIDCVVVTGTLNGNVSHAWNRVKTGDSWSSVDVTNNDNEQLPNALLNLPDSATSGVLIENDEYVMNNKLNQYTSNNDKDEYYRASGKYYSTDEIAAKLEEQLNSGKSAILRTDYSLDDETFNEIGQEVANSLHTNDLKGCYWLGVIHLEK